MRNETDKDSEHPLTYSQVDEFFDRRAEGKIPKELQSILLPELKSYKFQEIKADKEKQVETKSTIPMIPKWFATRPTPSKERIPIPARVLNNGKELDPLTVFGPDDRRIYHDTSYPWGTICKVVTSAGTGSGVIVGPRHVLTASHVVDWNSNGAGTVEVHRSAGSLRASTAITKVWSYTRVTGDFVRWLENDEDYVMSLIGLISATLLV